MLKKRAGNYYYILSALLSILGRIFGEKGYATLHSMIEVAKLYREQDLHEKAELLLLEAEQSVRRVFGNDHKITNESVSNLITLYEAWDKPEEAEQWQAKVPQKSR